MMSTFETLKQVDERTKDIVFGYIRLSKTESMVPIEICYICLLFYHLISEQFIECGEKMRIISSNESKGKVNDIVEMKEAEDREWAWITVHGNVIIDCKKNPDVIARWSIKTSVRYCVIGIHSDYTDLSATAPDYGWYGALYPPRFYKGDTVIMELNGKKKQLIYYKNDKLDMVRAHDIDPSKEYHLIIKVHTDSTKAKDNVQLIDFNIEGYTTPCYKSDSNY